MEYRKPAGPQGPQAKHCILSFSPVVYIAVLTILLFSEEVKKYPADPADLREIQYPCGFPARSLPAGQVFCLRTFRGLALFFTDGS
jgi:hypothetical protein